MSSNPRNSSNIEPIASDQSQNMILVNWDGEDDQKNPRNWSKATFLTHVFLVTTTMYAPGAAQLAIEFKTRDATTVALTVSIYLLGFALAPMILAPLSEVYGRLIVYHVSNLLFLGFNLGCAFSTNIGMFIAFRFLAGCAGSAPMTIGGGTIADLSADPIRNNSALKLFALGPLLGPVIGPIVGGFVTQKIGWRWTFRIMVIVNGVLGLLALILLKETSAAVILRRKGRAETQSRDKAFLIPGPFPGMPPAPQLPPKEIVLRSLIRPLKMLLFLPQVSILSFYTAFVFGLIYLLFTTFPAVFNEQYGFQPGISGLSYIGIGLGMISALLLFNYINLRMSGRTDENGQIYPESYLPLMTWFSPSLPIGFWVFGWTAEKQTHWIVPIIGTYFVGFGSFAMIMPTTAYLVFAQGPAGAASVLAANNLLRYLFAAFLPLAGQAMFDRLGLGWGNSLLGFICLLLAPIPGIFQIYGEALRRKYSKQF
ncbi:hypothetical protein FGRMN_3690 [Fusarium graminum]|nr:hypothetical protein FGRMN_3690 [Fusarium graminum]